MPKTIDRLKLLKALEPEEFENPTLEDVSWYGSVQDVFNPLEIETIYLKRAGALEVPFSCKDVELLKKRATSSREAIIKGTKDGFPSCGHAIEGNQLVFIPKAEDKTASEVFSKLSNYTLEKMFKIDLTHLNVTIEARCDKLIFCENGQSYESPHYHAKEPGMFASLLVQIPVITGKPSGTISFHNGTEEVKIGKLGKNEACRFAAVARCCKQPPSSSLHTSMKYVIQSQPNGIVAVMAFNLVWVEYLEFIESVPLEFIPEFFVRAYKISEILEAWNPATFNRQVIQNPTSSKDTAENEKKDVEYDSKVDAARTSFLCIPVNGLLSAEFGLQSWNLSKCDSFKMKTLRLLRFIDVDMAFMRCGSLSCIRQLSWNQPNKPILILKSITYEQSSIKNNLIGCQIDGERNLVGEFTISSASLIQYPITFEGFVILLIQPRMSHLASLSTQPNLDAIAASIDGIRANLTHQLVTCRLNATLAQCPTRRNILSELEFLFKTIEPFRFDYARVLEDKFALAIDGFRLCAQLNDEFHGLRAINFFLNISNSQKGQAYLPVRYKSELVYHLTDFICFASNWQTCRPLVFQMMDNSIIFSLELLAILQLADLLQSRSCTEGTSEIVDRMLSRLKTIESQLLWGFDLHGLELVVLGVKLDNLAESARSEQILSLVQHFSTSLLVQVLKTLSKLHQEKALLSPRWILRVFTSFLSCGKPSRDFTSEQFFEIVNIFLKFGEVSVLESSFQDILSKSIENPTKSCLFYEIITTGQSKIENREEIMKKLASFPLSEQAFLCLIDKVSDHLHAKDVAKFFQFSQFFGGPDDGELVSKLSSCFAKIGQVELCRSVAAIFAETKLMKGPTRASRIFENLLKQVVAQNAIQLQNPENISKFFEAVAWFGDRDVMHKLLDQLSAQKNIHEVISTTLHARNDGENNAASSLRFSREIFDSLILCLIKASRNLAETIRTQFVADCFLLLIKAEKSFIDSIDHKIVSELEETFKSVSANEGLKVATRVFQQEIDDETTPKLKKSPACWSLFSCLCDKVSSELNKEFLREILPTERVQLMQSFFWTADEKHMMSFCKALDQQWQYALDIVSDRKTAELALSSSQGLCALDELLDIIIGEAHGSSSIGRLRTLRKKMFSAIANKTEIDVQEVTAVLVACGSDINNSRVLKCRKVLVKKDSEKSQTLHSHSPVNPTSTSSSTPLGPSALLATTSSIGLSLFNPASTITDVSGKTSNFSFTFAPPATSSSTSQFLRPRTTQAPPTNIDIPLPFSFSSLPTATTTSTSGGFQFGSLSLPASSTSAPTTLSLDLFSVSTKSDHQTNTIKKL